MNKIIIGIVGIVFVILLALSIFRSGNSQSGNYAVLTVDEVYQRLQENNEVILIDVRTPPELSGPLGHIKGVDLKPVQEIKEWASEIDSLKNEEIILVCRSGNRSGVAADYLSKRGFTNVANMRGGMIAWNKKGYEIEK